MISIKNNSIHLFNNNISYVMNIDECGYLRHYYFGNKIDDVEYTVKKTEWQAFCAKDIDGVHLQNVSQEILLSNRLDFRLQGLKLNSCGCKCYDFKFLKYEQLTIKPNITNMPTSRGGETLKVVLSDNVLNIELELFYTIYDDINIITRRINVLNNSNNDVILNKVSSLSCDFFDSNRDIVYLPGKWCGERQISRKTLTQGKFSFGSSFGSTGHDFSPFVAICDRDTNEFSGNIFGFSLLYSGNHLTEIEVDKYLTTRVVMGINEENFSWTLKPSDFFESPECAICFSCNGLNGMSQNFHKFYQDFVINSKWKNSTRPILVNNWEATYFAFNEEKIVNFAKVANEIGLDMIVLDDGWFGKRNDDTTSLGDWYADKDKLPNGIDGLAKKVINEGVKFGLWFEPECISRKSQLFEKYPDYAMMLDNKWAVEIRNQLVLDLSKQETQKYILDCFDEHLKCENISYIKWDYNRYMTEIYDGEISHRQVLGLYSVLKKLTEKYPKLLIEGCAGGGGRFDGAMLYYCPQIWTSDNTDAISRLSIQSGTSLVFPQSTISNHISAVPNHQTHRVTPIETRANVAFNGVFGYELDITKFSTEEKLTVKKQIEFYKKYQDVMLYGKFIRLKNGENGFYAWQVISNDKKTVILTLTKCDDNFNANKQNLKLYDDFIFNKYIDDFGKIYTVQQLINFEFQFDYETYSSKIYCFQGVDCEKIS